VITLVALVVYLGSTSRPKVKPVASTPTDQVDRARLEEQANRLLQAAIDFYTTKQFPQAVATLQDLVNQFGGTQASQQALLALDRQQRGEPLFGEMQAPSPERPSDEQVAAAPKKKPVIGIPSAPPSVEPSANTAPTDLVTTSPPDRPRAPPRGSTLAKSDARPRALPPGFTAVDTSGVHSSGWPIEIMCLKDSSHMMLVPEGDFEMGSDVEASNAQPAHRVRLKTYYIDKFEITLGQYEGFLDQRRLEKNPYRALSPAVSSVAKSGKHPVVGTAWRDARAYALWAGKNLPTEAQWEKAARGTDRRLYPWGTDPPVWGRPRQPRQIDPVGSFTWDVSVFGCYDMAGNAWEWCADWFDPNYYRTSPTDDPDGPASFLPPVEHLDPERALRGGSPRWNIEPLHVGFRCVLEVEKTSPLAAATVPGQTPTSTSPKPPAPQPERRPAKLPPGGFRF
jgi:formylglycine-generating enzyme required for sulfatase activity